MFKKLHLACLFGFTSLAAAAADVAAIETTNYPSLADAFSAAAEGQTITLLVDTDIDAMIPVTKSVTLDLNGKAITNNVAGNRLFRLSGVTFTIDGNGGKVTIPTTNAKSYGFVDFRDAANAAAPATSLIVRDATFEGATNDGSLFAFRADGQSIEFYNVNVNCTPSNTYSIINGYEQKVSIKVSGGEYVFDSNLKTVGAFQAGPGSDIVFDNVNVNASAGPIFECVANTATFSDCDFTCTATNSYFASCLAASYGAVVNVNGGEYSANFPLYVYNSGGSINVDGGTFNGAVAAIKADNDASATSQTKITVDDGTFIGNVSVDNRSELIVKGGSYTTDVSNYCADGFTTKETIGEDGKPVFTIVGAETIVVETIGDTTGNNDENRVYIIQGIFVGHETDNLPAGIYIKNSKTIYVTK